MKMFATITYGAHGWENAISVTGTAHQIADHMFWLARTMDTVEPRDGYVEYKLKDDMADPYNPAMVILSSDIHGERDFCVVAFVHPAVEL